MKKYILIVSILALLIASSVQAVPYNDKNTLTKITNPQPTSADFTHTVFAEESTATWCPNCPFAAKALENVYASGDYPFYYVTLINDETSTSKDRMRDYTFGLLQIYAYPSVYFDGGDVNFVGRETTVNATEADYRGIIEQEGARTPKQPLTLDSQVVWNGDAKLTITVNVTNDGTLPYFGKLRTYVTEIVSRWSDNDGDPYHYGFMDFAINKAVLLMPGKTKTIQASFDGAAAHGNRTYADITPDNVMVISAVFNWIPHYRIGYESTQYTQRYFAHIADQCTAAVPS